jgi:hypothetical protein
MYAHKRVPCEKVLLFFMEVIKTADSIKQYNQHSNMSHNNRDTMKDY